MTAFLKGSALVAATGDLVTVIDREIRADLRIDTGFDPEDLRTVLRDGLAAFAALVGEDPDAIMTSLAETGLITAARPADISLPWAMRLADAIADSHSLDGSRVIYTSGEAFVPGDDPELARFAFRVFVSTIAGIDRCVVYSRLAAGDRLAVAGDQPAPGILNRLLGRWEDVKVPTVFDLGSGQMTGEAADITACWTGHAGRLNITTLTCRQDWQLGTERLTWVSGRTAFSNLAALPRVQASGMSPEVDYPRVSGVDMSVEMAVRKCVAEGAERFAAGAVHVADLHQTAAASLTEPWLHPDSIFSYTAPQRRRLRLSSFDVGAKEWWVLGESRNGPVWIPAALVFYPFPVPAWLSHHAVSSSGMAAHESTDKARERAWLELVERDALQRARFQGLTDPPPLIRLDSLTGRIASLVQLLRCHGPVHVLQLPSPTGVPVALVRTATPSMLAIGMAAADDFADAVLKAATEALVEVAHPFARSVAPEAVNDPGDHAALYISPEWRRKLDWMTEGPLISIKQVKNFAAKQLGTRAVWYELPHTPSGLHVVRVLDPDLIPLTFGYDSDPAGRADMRCLIKAAGLADDHPLDPHPFA